MNRTIAQLKKAILIRTKEALAISTKIDKIEVRISRLNKQLATVLGVKVAKALPPKKQLSTAEPKAPAGNKPKKNMYKDAQTWNPFVGCEFDCTYCGPSFQRQAKRQKQNCMKCYKYTPHFHSHQLSKIPKNKKIVFVCGSGDVSFCKPEDMLKIIEAIKQHEGDIPQVFYLQSKQPSCLKPYLKLLPKNVILVTTLETNRDKGYGKISKAPVPSKRYRQFLALKYPRKVVTIEPLMDFDVKIFAMWIIKINPEYVWIGFNSKEKEVSVPEPSKEKVLRLMNILRKHNIKIKEKTMRY